MGQIADSLGVGPEFEYKGKTYNLHPLTYEVQGAFERYLEKQAIDTFYRLSSRLGDDDRKSMLASLHRDITNKYYTFGSGGVRQALEASVHLEHLIYLMIKKNHPEVAPELVTEMFKDAELRERIMVLSNSTSVDPNPPAPATPGA